MLEEMLFRCLSFLKQNHCRQHRKRSARCGTGHYIKIGIVKEHGLQGHAVGQRGRGYDQGYVYRYCRRWWIAIVAILLICIVDLVVGSVCGTYESSPDNDGNEMIVPMIPETEVTV